MDNTIAPVSSNKESPGGFKAGAIPDAQSIKVGQSNDTVSRTQRRLLPRHIQLIAIGGSIGTGLFVGIGGVLAQAGPLSVFLGYLLWGVFFIYTCNLCVAEMVTYLPVRGTMFELAGRFVDPALGFAMGWTYLFGSSMLVCVEYTAVATLMQYWNTTINPGVWIALSLVVCVGLNLAAVKWFGEAEFVMASTKIILLVGLIMLTLVTMCGGNPQNDAYGFRHWGNGNAMHEYVAEGTTGRFLGLWSVIVYAAFTIGGPDMIALTAGEIQNPRRTIPRVARLIFYRLVGFYVIGVLAVGIICSSQDPRLMGAIESGAPGSAASPWVIGIENLGISGFPDLINALILLSGLSCGNAYFYAATRTLYGLAQDGQAPKIFKKCTKSGVPIYCVGCIALVGCAAFMVTSDSAITVFFWFVDLTTGAISVTYTSMLITWVCWYRARKTQPNVLPDSTLPYRAPFTPYSSYLALVLGCTLCLFLGFNRFSPFNVRGFITSYFALAFASSMFVLWKFIKRTSFVNPKEADLLAGKAEVDEECKVWEDGTFEREEKIRLQEAGILRRAWEKMW